MICAYVASARWLEHKINMPMQDLGEAHSPHLQASLPADGLIGQGKQKATEEAASCRNSAAADSVDMHDSFGLCLELDNEHHVQEDTDSASVATVKVGSLAASSVATTEVVQASAMQHEYASTAQSARPEQDACCSELPSKALSLTPVDAAVDKDQSNQAYPGQSTHRLDADVHGRQLASQDKRMQTAQVTALSTGDQHGRMGAHCQARPASSSSAGPASRQASLAMKRHAECSASAEMSAVKKASDGLHDDQEPMQHPEVPLLRICGCFALPSQIESVLLQIFCTIDMQLQDCVHAVTGLSKCHD